MVKIQVKSLRRIGPLGYINMTKNIRRIFKTCTWQLLGIVWFMSYALVTGGDLWYTFGLSIASIPAGSIMFYCHEWIWERV